jgi:photosystem II stability/assembly factor-like uncharacterized protein
MRIRGSAFVSAACLTAVTIALIGCMRAASTGPSSAERSPVILQTNAVLNCVRFADSKMGWAAGGSGVILRTADGGSTWTTQTSNASAELHGLWFEDARTGHVVGEQGTILVTRDGGETWGRQRSGVTVSLRAVQFVDSKTGFVAGGDESGPGVLLRTLDGGASWHQIHEFKSGRLFSVSFLNARSGRAVGMDGTVLLATEDGGVTWTTHVVPFENTNYYLLSTQFMTSKTGWIVGGEEFGVILHTSDGGETWTGAGRMRDTHAVVSIRMVTDTEGWAAGYGGAVYYTKDGGEHWSRRASGTLANFISVASVDASHACAVGWSEDGAHGVIVSVDSEATQ